VTTPDAQRPQLEFALGNLTLHVEHRLDRSPRGRGGEGGPTLRVRDATGRELLRFDCFRCDPHYHLADAPELVAFGPVPDPVSWAIEELRSDFSGYLQRVGSESGLGVSASDLREALDAVESSLRNPPAQLDDLDSEMLKTRKSEKWHTYPNDIQPAWVAEMDFPLAEPIRVVLERAVDRWDIGYPIAPKDTGLPEAFSDRMERVFDWKIDPRRVEILTDVVQALYVGLQSYTEPGDGAVIQTPIYPPFLTAARETGRKVVEHRLLVPRADEPGYELELDSLGARIDERTRILLLCNPHNPTGRVFRRDELVAIAELAREHDWVVVVDEIHEDLVYSGRAHIPFATLSDDAAARTVTVTSATKAFNIPGLRTAVAHFGSADLQRRFNSVIPRHTRGGIGVLGLYATIAAWRHAQPWLDEVRPYLEANRDLVAEFLAREIPEIRFQLPESTYLFWLDCRALELEPNPARFFYDRAKVALSDGAAFGPGWEGFARLNFATSRNLLTEILEKLAKAIHSR
jgi:cystathionine beta-lyase